jgi:general secretion pathway protein G
MKRTDRRGFTLLEIMAVVVILGILATIVMAQYANTTRESAQTALKTQLQAVRQAVELYKIQHRDRWPTDTGTPTAAGVNWNLLTTATPGNDDRPYGPYLARAPGNPFFNNSSSFGTGTDAPWQMDGDTGVITAASAQ